MSFSSITKSELADHIIKKDCCKKSRLLGLILFSGGLSYERFHFTTEIEDVYQIVSHFLFENLKITPFSEITNGAKKTTYKISISEESDVRKINNYFAIGRNIDIYDDFYLSSENAVCSMLKCNECEKHFIAGVFMSCGFVYDPSQKYQLEFAIKNSELFNLLLGMMNRIGFEPKTTKRNDKKILYIQGATKTSDFLGYIGATNSYFSILNSQALHETTEAAVRQTNFEYANLMKTTSASSEQIKAINILKNNGKFANLSPELKMTATNRIENEFSTLNELAEMEGISKSQISKRLKKLVELSKE